MEADLGKPMAYEAPADILNDPGSLFKLVLDVCYDRPKSARYELYKTLGVSRQAVWAWTRPFEGLPDTPEYRRTLAEMLKDPAKRLRLPSNITLDQIFRAKNQPVDRNEAFLHFLETVASSPDQRFGRSALDYLLQALARSPRLSKSPNITPAILYKWGYEGGGIPDNLVRKFAGAAIQIGAHELFNMTTAKFRQHVLTNMIQTNQPASGV